MNIFLGSKLKNNYTIALQQFDSTFSLFTDDIFVFNYFPFDNSPMETISPHSLHSDRSQYKFLILWLLFFSSTFDLISFFMALEREDLSSSSDGYRRSSRGSMSSSNGNRTSGRKNGWRHCWREEVFSYPASLNIGNHVSIFLFVDNFLHWWTQFVSLLEGQILIEFVDDSIKAPQNSLPHQLWRRTNQLVKGWITSRLTPSILSLITGIETIKGVWDTFKSLLLKILLRGSLCYEKNSSWLKKIYSNIYS